MTRNELLLLAGSIAVVLFGAATLVVVLVRLRRAKAKAKQARIAADRVAIRPYLEDNTDGYETTLPMDVWHAYGPYVEQVRRDVDAAARADERQKFKKATEAWWLPRSPAAEIARRRQRTAQHDLSRPDGVRALPPQQPAGYDPWRPEELVDE